jgi:hypothetical protein
MNAAREVLEAIVESAAAAKWLASRSDEDVALLSDGVLESLDGIFVEMIAAIRGRETLSSREIVCDACVALRGTLKTNPRDPEVIRQKAQSLVALVNLMESATV